MDDETRLIEGALTLTKGSMDDWYLIERAEHDGREWFEQNCFMTAARISNADIEGTKEEMNEIAAMIECRGEFVARRCAVKVTGDFAEFWSPRNSIRRGRVPLAVADALAKQIRGT